MSVSLFEEPVIRPLPPLREEAAETVGPSSATHLSSIQLGRSLDRNL